MAACAKHQNAPANTSAIIVNMKQLPETWPGSADGPHPAWLSCETQETQLGREGGDASMVDRAQLL